MKVVEGAVVSEKVTDDVNVEKIAESGDIPLVVSVSMFFVFLGSAGKLDVATQLGESISMFWDVLVSVWVLEVR